MENSVVVPCSWPWLVFASGENQVVCDVVSDPKTTGFVRSIPESIFNRSVLMPTNINGWFLLESSSESCLWNALTLQSIDLPPLKPEYCIDCILLTKSPADPKCMVLLLLGDRLGILYCYVNEDDDWTFRDYQEELKESMGGRVYPGDRFSYLIACDDKIFLISHFSCAMAKIEIVKPKHLVIRSDLSFPKIPHSHVVGPGFKILYRWVACCGDLFVITVTYGGLGWNQIVNIDVFKLYFSDMSWTKVDSCPNIAFFLKGPQFMACPIASSDSSKVGNRVYIVEEGRLLLRTYHIQQKTLQISLIATPKHESKSYWMLVPDAQVLAKDEDDYHNGVDSKYGQLFIKEENTRDLVAHKDYEHENTNFSTVLDDLPIDILKTILSHLISPLDYLNFRATCRSFRDDFSAKDWRSIQAFESDSSLSPWLFYHTSPHVGKCIFSMVDPVSRNKYYLRTPETLEEDSRICYSANGWLLMSSISNVDGELNLFLYIPETNSTISLPKINVDATHFFMDCTSIVAISVNMRPYFRMIFPKISSEDEFDNDDNDTEWELIERSITRDYAADQYLVQQSNVNAVFVGKVYHFLVGDGNIAYFSEGDYTLRIHNLEEPCSRSSYEEYFLAKCDEDLLSIYIGNEWKWLRAFKFNQSGMAWNEVKDLKNNNLYLSYVSSTTSKPQSPDVGNRIYFSRFYQDSIVYYSFNTQKFHISDGHDSVMSNYDGSKEQMYSCWIEPSWELEE